MTIICGSPNFSELKELSHKYNKFFGSCWFTEKSIDINYYQKVIDKIFLQVSYHPAKKT